MDDETRSTLCNAVRNPATTISAIEIDTDHYARELIADITGVLQKRPWAILETGSQEIPGTREALQLLDRAREETKNWPAEQGVLFVLELQSGMSSPNPKQRDPYKIDFWQVMNQLREGWGALNCHVIFLLYAGRSGGFQYLLTVADHLADWMPLKFTLTQKPSVGQNISQSAFTDLMGGYILPETAKTRLKNLEEELHNTLQHSPGKPALLAQKYYLPMLEAALALNDLNRAKSLRDRVTETSPLPIADSSMPQWLKMNYELDIKLYNLKGAGKSAEDLSHWAKSKNNKGIMALSYHHLGIIAQKKRDFDTAELWYKKSLAIDEKQGDEHGVALSYHQLGRIAEEKRDFDTAEHWYKKSLAIFEKQGNEHGVAISYHQLGRIAQEKRDFDTAEQWYKKSLAIKEKQGDEHGAASSYHNLGIIAQEKRDFDTAELWYKKSMAIKEKQGDEHGAGLTFSQMGLMFRAMENYEQSGKSLLQGVKKFAGCGDERMAALAMRDFLETVELAPRDVQGELRRQCKDCGLERFMNAVQEVMQ